MDMRERIETLKKEQDAVILAHYYVSDEVQAIADSISETVRTEAGEKPVKVVGEDNAVWVAMDYTDVMVHVFVPDTREYYDIEHLWEDAPKTVVPNEE